MERVSKHGWIGGASLDRIYDELLPRPRSGGLNLTEVRGLFANNTLAEQQNREYTLRRRKLRRLKRKKGKGESRT
jgi:hypothetical protein